MHNQCTNLRQFTIIVIPIFAPVIVDCNIKWTSSRDAKLYKICVRQKTHQKHMTQYTYKSEFQAERSKTDGTAHTHLMVGPSFSGLYLHCACFLYPTLNFALWKVKHSSNYIGTYLKQTSLKPPLNVRNTEAFSIQSFQCISGRGVEHNEVAFLNPSYAVCWKERLVLWVTVPTLRIQ